MKPSPKTRSRKSAEDRKAEIVAAAIRLAGELGPDRVTTQRIADEVGLTQPGIFRHFPAKTDIWLAVGHWVAPSPDAIGGHPAPALASTDPAKQIRAMVSRFLSGIARHPAIPAILFSRELHVENEQLRAHFEGVMTARRIKFAQLIEQAKTAGQIADTTIAQDQAALILALIQGLAMRWSLERRSFDLEAEGMRLLESLMPAP